MNCNSYDLAAVTRASPGSGLHEDVLRAILGRIVRVTYIDGDNVWQLEEPLYFENVRIAAGRLLVSGYVDAIADHHLTPLRGDGPTEETDTPVIDALYLATGITAGAFE